MVLVGQKLQGKKKCRSEGAFPWLAAASDSIKGDSELISLARAGRQRRKTAQHRANP